VTTTGDPTKTRTQSVWTTDIAKKYAMAISGILGLLFVFFHMVGNLHAFEGTDPTTGEPRINEYGEALRDIGEPNGPTNPEAIRVAWQTAESELDVDRRFSIF